MTQIQAVGYVLVKTMRWTTTSSMSRVGLLLLAALAIVLAAFSPSYAVVAISDGFGDGDRNNDGIAFEEGVDVEDTTDPNDPAHDGFYLAIDGVGSVFDPNTYVMAPTVADNSNDTGIHWTSTGGITNNGFGTPAARPRIINDAAGFLPETVGNQGFLNSISGETQHIPALDSGLALSFEGAGRTRSIAGFFETDKSWNEAGGNGKQGTIQLGPNVDDEVIVSFDFRVWMSAPNDNDNNPEDHVPVFGQLRFGLYQDADDELGSVNPFAGVDDPNLPNLNPLPAVWGEDDGWFRGELQQGGNNLPDVSGDPGWFTRLTFADKDAPINPLFGPFPGGVDARINEETNPNPGDQFMHGNGTNNGGDNQTVALPSQDPNNPNFVTLDTLKRYNLSLSLKRFDETGGTGDPNNGGSLDPNDPGDNIVATLMVKDLDSLQEWTLSGFNTLFQDPNEPEDPDLGFDSDAWDYFALSTGGVSDGDEFDFLIDNFMVEVLGSNEGDYIDDANADFDGNGIVDGLDFLRWQRGETPENGSPAELALWEAQYGQSVPLSAISAAVPEPATILMAGLGSVLALGLPRRRWTFARIN